jgi:hypothetical protein
MMPSQPHVLPARRAALSWQFNLETVMPKPPIHQSLAILLSAALLGACATSAPVVVPTSAADSARVARDSEQCRSQATAAVGLNGRNAGTVASSAGKAGTVGFVAGAVGGLVAGSKDVWQKARGAAAGGASGIATKVLLEWNEPDDVHQEYVERCMKKRGHDVLGWR